MIRIPGMAGMLCIWAKIRRGQPEINYSCPLVFHFYVSTQYKLVAHNHEVNTYRSKFAFKSLLKNCCDISNNLDRKMASVEWENISSTLNIKEENLEQGWLEKSEKFIWIPAQILLFCELLIGLSGLIFNYYVLDVSRRNPQQNSGSFWMKHVATWDNLSLVAILPRTIASLLFQQDLRTLGGPVCKIFSYILWAISLNSSAHMVGMALDRALNISFPDWHYPKHWKTIIPKISIGLTVLHFVLVTPHLVFLELGDSVCEMTSSHTAIMRGYQVFVSIVLSFIGNSAAIAVASLVFVRKLRERRTPNAPSEPEQKQGIERNVEPIGDTKKKTRFDGKEANEEFNLNEAQKLDQTGQPEESNQTDFIYCGPNNSIPTNFVGAPKRGEVCIEMKTVDIKGPKSGNENGKKSGVFNKGFQETEFGKTGRDQTTSNIMGAGDVIIDVELTKSRDQPSSSQSNTAMGSSGNDDMEFSHKRDASGTKTTSNFNEVSDSGAGRNKTKAAEKGKKKVAPVFSPEDIKAIRTLSYISLFFLFTKFTSTVLFMLKENFLNSESSVAWKIFLENLAGVLIVSNHAFNFFFYLRGRSFRETFKAKWWNNWRRNGTGLTYHHQAPGDTFGSSVDISTLHCIPASHNI